MFKNIELISWRRTNVRHAIVLEGPDNIGKSYLANTLKRELALIQNGKEPKIVHCGPPVGTGKSAFIYQQKYLKSVVERVKDDTRDVEIWDRSVIGEDVYGPMYRTGQYDHDVYSQELKDSLQEVRTKLIVIAFYANLDFFKQFGIEKKEDETKKYQRMMEAPKIATRFIDVIARLGLKRTLYVNCANYASLDERNTYVISRVKTWMKLAAYQHTQTDSYRHTFFNPMQMLWETERGFIDGRMRCGAYDDESCQLGRDHAAITKFGCQYHRPTGPCGAVTNIKYIFVGEAPGENGCGKTGIPFYDDRSGNLLQTTLDRLGIHPVHYYMTNVVKCCPVDNKLSMYVSKHTIKDLECVQTLSVELGPIVKKNPFAKIIALGKVAAEQLKRLHFKYHTVYHPAYYLRMGISDDFYRELKLVVED